jgi:4-oxalocrotonate tautomerase
VIGNADPGVQGSDVPWPLKVMIDFVKLSEKQTERKRSLRPLRCEKSKEGTMPHVIVKLYSGRSEQQKTRLAQQICNAVTSVLSLGEESVSVGIEDIPPAEWTNRVYKPDILGDPKKIYKQPGYSPAE